MTIKKSDFVEIEFTARIKGGDIFDTTKKVDAKEIGIDENSLKPLIISVGNSMVVKGLDNDLLEKELKKNYSLEIKPEEAFGKRSPSLVQMVPLKVFSEQKVFPQKGMQFSLDGRIARIVSVSGGRVLVDFNNPLAGKDLVYDYKILRKVEDSQEKLEALQEFFFKKKFDSKIEGSSAKIKVDKKFMPLFEIMKPQFEEMLGLKLVLEKF